jgi:hypothetical protein
MAAALSAGMVGRPNRTPEAGASLAGKETFADHLAFKFSEHARHLQQRLSRQESSCRRLAHEDKGD